jgi:hypothetical protein
MSWQAHQIVLRLCSPMHIGQSKIGNVQRTRPYVTGRVLWGALTLRLTRDRFRGQGPATRSDQYRRVGQQVHEHLAFTYLYPTTDPDGQVGLWPWGDDEDGFHSRYLSTYASTALSYPQQSADEGTLHEVEFVSPRTLDSGQPVYLVGYVFARQEAPPWQAALGRLQLGGERGYGWGRVEPMEVSDVGEGEPLFGGQYALEQGSWPPVLKARKNTCLVAHALATGLAGQEPVQDIQGEIEPLVGRETAPDGRFGVQISKAYVCYVPGSKVKKSTRLQIGHYGVWKVT